MKHLAPRSSQHCGTSVSRQCQAKQTPLRIAGICLLSLLLAACGGSSGSGTVSGSQAPNQDAGTQVQQPSTPSTPESPEQPADDNSSYNLGATPQAVIDQCMSDADKEMLTRVNDARAMARFCGSDNFAATTALSWQCTLEEVADGHNRDMGDHNFFSHTGSDGLTVSNRVTNAGYDWSAVGENIAAGYPTTESVMTAWLDSPGHCANIMNPVYTEFGAASYTVSGSDFPIYWTQVFARPR